MKDLKQLTLDCLGKKMTQMAIFGDGWPPACVGPFYQPERPRTRIEVTENNIETEKQDKI